MKNQLTKRALFGSLASLGLSAIMMVGTTFAWFTDSAESKGNIIKTGSLEVGMSWAKATEDPTLDTTVWTDASAGAIFNNDKWEPGYVEAKHIKIENLGTLALKYSVSIVATGTVSDLSDAIDVYYVDPAVQVQSVSALTDENKLGTLTDVLANLENTASGALLEGEKDTVTLALKMREDAGNEYQNKSIGTSFSVQLFATQYTYEEDSFGKDYDANAPLPTFCKTPESLSSALGQGGNSIMADNLTVADVLTMKGGILDGSGNTLQSTQGRGTRLLDTTGGTIKNINIVGNGYDGPYAIGSNQYGGTTLTSDLCIEKANVSNTYMAIDLTANGNSVYVKDSVLNNNIQIIDAKETVFENCHFTKDNASALFNAASATSHIFIMGSMTFINCHFEESINFYLDKVELSGTLTFIGCTYGNNGVEDRPFEPTVGFFTWWMNSQYYATFSDGKPARTNFTCIVDDTVVWEAQN